mmetsp:Transcript_69793/g.110745  ORF Transcript_69793/g.110745 Transcript_69793/m.110745 type:complete len:212 (+) Transcript_69793:2954-3589(+)
MSSILTLAATLYPMMPASKNAAKKRRWAPPKPGEASTERMPKAVATIPIKLPRCAVECLFNPRSEPMNITADVSEKSPTWVANSSSTACSTRPLSKKLVAPKPLSLSGKALIATPPAAVAEDSMHLNWIKDAPIIGAPAAAPAKVFAATLVQAFKTCTMPDSLELRPSLSCRGMLRLKSCGLLSTWIATAFLPSCGLSDCNWSLHAHCVQL